MSEATFVAPANARPIAERNQGSQKIYYFGEDLVASPAPQGFMVKEAANVAHRAHFHHIEQFQVFFGASDTVFQREDVGPLLVHYADADTLYGPFSAGENPYIFYTLRIAGSDFAGFMPEDKEKMSHGQSKRHFAKDLRDWFADDTFGTDTDVSSVIDPQGDGLSAFRFTVPPNAKFVAPSPSGSGGQYVLVVKGEVFHGEQRLPQYSLGWVNHDDDAAELVAGAEGARVLVMQFGERSLAA